MLSISDDFSLDETDLKVNSGRATYIYPGIMLEDCNGALVAIEYCYQAFRRDIGDMNSFRTLFFFLSLAQSELRFKVNRILSVEYRPNDNICTNTSNSGREICCDFINLEMEQKFTISPSNFTFGIAIERGPLIFFSDKHVRYHVNRFEESLIDKEVPQKCDELNNTKFSSNHSLPLMRLIIGNRSGLANSNLIYSLLTQSWMMAIQLLFKMKIHACCECSYDNLLMDDVCPRRLLILSQ